MKYLLDTDISSYYLRGRYNLDKAFDIKGTHNIAISIVTIAQMQVLAFKNLKSSKKPTRINFENIEELIFELKARVIDVDRETWAIFSETRAELELSGLAKGELDILQASIAKQHSLVVVTNNIKHFEGLVETENWTSL